VRRSHPSPACGRGAGGEGQTAHPNASNVEFARMFCPPVNPPAGEGPGVRVNKHISASPFQSRCDTLMRRAPRQARRATAPFPAYAGTTAQGRWLSHSIALYDAPTIQNRHNKPSTRCQPHRLLVQCISTKNKIILNEPGCSQAAALPSPARRRSFYPGASFCNREL
jgi:hypothetical protein